MTARRIAVYALIWGVVTVSTALATEALLAQYDNAQHVGLAGTTRLVWQLIGDLQ